MLPASISSKYWVQSVIAIRRNSSIGISNWRTYYLYPRTMRKLRPSILELLDSNAKPTLIMSILEHSTTWHQRYWAVAYIVSLHQWTYGQWASSYIKCYLEYSHLMASPKMMWPVALYMMHSDSHIITYLKRHWTCYKPVWIRTMSRECMQLIWNVIPGSIVSRGHHNNQSWNCWLRGQTQRKHNSPAVHAIPHQTYSNTSANYKSPFQNSPSDFAHQLTLKSSRSFYSKIFKLKFLFLTHAHQRRNSRRERIGTRCQDK